MKDPLVYVQRVAERARLDEAPVVHATNGVMAAIRAEHYRRDRVLPWMVAASAAVAAGMSAQLFTIARALSNPLATLFHMSATLIP
ncbi:hypothetical protein JXA88_08440 [Candidatus Fermentibacteria bacterium]|nr:hypothetical protein [Candidatus Fermentibacteria bacterium]